MFIKSPSFRCWDVDTGQCLRVFAGHKKGVYPMVYVPGDEEEKEDGNEENKNIEEQDGGDRETKVKTAGDKDLLITGSADHTCIVWGLETEDQVGC